ncbi:MAG TPA: glycosyltransferase [Terriglobales bacterium]|nr:glycosyltransferase [Terriglobales bacterium]
MQTAGNLAQGYEEGIENMKPLVSVIIAVRNGERYLPAAIESVRQQDYRPLELIVVDGHSSDNTAAIARSYRDLRYVPQVNRGVADAWNQGIAAAKADLLAFFSHDDLWLPHKLGRHMDLMLSRPELQYTVSRVKFFLEPGHSIPSGFREELLVGDRVAYIPETLVARKALFARIGGFDPQLSTAEDVDWFARAKDHHVTHEVIPEVLVHKRVHDSNISLNSMTNDQMLLTTLRQSIHRKRTFDSKTMVPGSAENGNTRLNQK